MLTGVELAGIVLATFPLVISGLEHYQNGFQCVKAWIRFRVEFTRFLNNLCRQKIFFRQNIEALLSPIVASEYEMSHLLNNPRGQAWYDQELNEKLKNRLPGLMEYECYMATVSSILEVLEKLKYKMKIFDGQFRWTEKSSNLPKIRWGYELKRVNYVLGQKQREKLMIELEKHNNDIQNLLGNSERLEPMRRKRKSTIPKFFQRVRSQASNLHSALGSAWKCDCSKSHITKLLLETRIRKDNMGLIEVQDSTPVNFIVFFYPEQQSIPEWYGTEIMLAGPSIDINRKVSQSTDLRRYSLGSTKTSRFSDSNSRSVSFLGGDLESLPSSAPCDGIEIIDLCTALKQRSKVQQFLGYLRDGPDRHFTVDTATWPKLSSLDTTNMLTLESLLIKTGAAGHKETKAISTLPRRTRLAIAVILATSLLQLHSGPWLRETWSKRDIYFFQSSDGVIQTNHPFVLNHFQSTISQRGSEHILSQVAFQRPPIRAGNPSLLALGIIILELWFNQTIESQPFRKDFVGPDGKENEYTDFNTALKWQEMTMDEAGPDLYNPTRRCIYCAFGAASQDLEDDELRRAVYDEVVQPLGRLLGRFEDV